MFKCLNNSEANFVDVFSNCKIYFEMDTTGSDTNEELIYNLSDCSDVIPEMEDHSVIISKSLTVPSDNAKWKPETAPVNSFQKVYRCTICGYTSEYQRTIKTHVWKHSGHKNVDYPMFECTTVNCELDSNTNNVPLKEKPSSVLKTISENGQEFPYKEVTQLKETTINNNSNEYSILLQLLQSLPDRKTKVENSSNHQLTTNLSTVCNFNNSYTSLNNGEVFAQSLEMKNGKHALEEIDPDSKKKLHRPMSIHVTSEPSKSFFKTSKNTSNYKNSKLLETLLGSFQNTSSKCTYFPQNTTNVKIESFTAEEVPIKNFDNCSKLGISSSLLSVVELFHKDSAMEEEAKEKDAKNISKGKVKSSSRLITDDVSIEKMDLIEILEQPAGFYRCKLCHYKSSVKAHMRLHMRVHKSKKPFECSLCDFLGDCQLSLQEHTIQHCKLRTYHCKYCSSVFNYKSQLRTHSHIHEQHQLQQLLALPEYSKDDCNLTNEETNVSKYESSDQIELDLSKNLLNVKNDELLKCDQCDFLALSSRSLKSHMKRHINDQRYLHQPLEQYKCCLCGYVCHYLPSMKSHMWRHAGNENYIYTITQASPIINTASLNEDSSDSREKAYSLVQEITQELEQNLVIFCCHECGFESADQAIIIEHLKMKHHQSVLVESPAFIKM